VTAIVTWYSFDFLTPSDMNLSINEGRDWPQFQHGVSAPRYLVAIATQLPVTLFSIAYIRAAPATTFRNAIICTAMGAAISFGLMYGHYMAEQ
jgi:hypothetical protein